ncbi:MAG: 6-pyruvoyl-tetrahydropterin synthase-related protein [Desulfocucumaceae bacterium]
MLEAKDTKTYHNYKLLEFIFSVFMISVVIIFSIWPVFSAPNTMYLVTSDGLGHLAKIKYLADCIKDLNWPSWFPYWYNGSTTMQYYPPLSYVLLVPVQIIFNNSMITYKFFLFSTQFIGSIGVWYLCYRFIGPWAGILGGAIYAVQPFLIRSMLLSGVVAQGPIYALTPWLLLFTLLFLKNKTPLSWVSICLTVSLLILSHPMHAYLLFICIAFFVIALFAQGLISISQAFIWMAAFALGAGLVSFWWLPGVTQLETPGIPFLLPEAAGTYTATPYWYNPLKREGSWFYFSFSALLLIPALTIILYFIERKINKTYLAILFSFAASIYMSFGLFLPLFKYIPMSSALVPGRVLSYSSLAMAILYAYIINRLVNVIKTGYRPILIAFLCIFMIIVTTYDVNPRLMRLSITDFRELRSDIDTIPVETGGPFNNGRFSWLFPLDSAITYLPLLKGLNMGDGWNIEGTPHNKTIWLHNIAIIEQCGEYVVKNLLQWNTRSVIVNKKYSSIIKNLQALGFQPIKEDQEKILLYNPQKSSYFLHDERNTIAIGRASPAYYGAPEPPFRM